MICWVRVALRQAYSLGQLIPTHPPACIFLCHSTRRFQSSELLSRMKSMPSSAFPALGKFAESQLRNSERNASSSALNLKSIEFTTSVPEPNKSLFINHSWPRSDGRRLADSVPNTCSIEPAREPIPDRDASR